MMSGRYLINLTKLCQYYVELRVNTPSLVLRCNPYISLGDIVEEKYPSQKYLFML